MLSPQAAAHEQALRDRRESPPEPDPDLSPLTVARQIDALFASWASDPGCANTEIDAGGVRSIWIEPADVVPGRTLLYFHGGAYILGTADHVVKMVGHIATRARCRALSVDYRLAPENPYPAALDDALAAYTWLLDDDLDPGQIVVAGDSAGGGLTLATLLAIRGRGLPQPAGAVPISPWADLSCTSPTWQTAADTDMLLEQENLTHIGQMYMQRADVTDPLVSPTHASYVGLPPLYVQAAGGETLLDDALSVTAAAARDGLAVTLDVTPGMQHVFQYCAGAMPEADAAIDRIAAWLLSTFAP